MSLNRPEMYRFHNGGKKDALPFADQEYHDRLKGLRAIMEKNEVEASVVALLKEEIVISMGTNYGIEVGHTLIVRKDGEILKDPDSGAILDRLEGEVTGTIEITRVREKTAYCKLIDGTMPVRGDRVVLKAK